MISKKTSDRALQAIVALAVAAALVYAYIVVYTKLSGGHALCVQGYVHFVDSNGNARQILNTDGNGVPCAEASP